ncbi:uncharacterized protein LOC121324020 isoform X2 [Polyodon spathula]|uniref:uncharacterized protein LOC121324020 isoform X2 n=1 Tax=Polyodon spathula TaxID=7913 RepID=UPI001B7DFD81|nr:uncharacterized protein LOC121324020 isoform X2 [Polyodon spathula]
MQQGTGGWLSEENVSEQACQAGDYEKLAQVCIMSKRPHLALEYSGKATKIRQKAFGNDHPITTRSLELLASVYAEIGKTEYSGQYTSALSKTFSPADSFSKVLNGVPLAKTEVCQDRKRLHKKDLLLSSTNSKEKVTTCKCLTSILRKRSSFSCSENEFTHRKKSDRRVRFREPEIIVHAYEQSTNRTHFALLACIFILLSVLGVVLYCTDKRRPLKVCEELESVLIVYFLQMKQILWGY